jgi:hypothetical protein
MGRCVILSIKVLKRARAKPAETAVIVLLIAVVAAGLFVVFAQFRPDAAQEYVLTHTAKAGMTYYEWDEAGFRRELEPVYGVEGWLSDLGNAGSRVGYSVRLDRRIDDPILSLYSPGDVIVFLDGNVVYTDFPTERTSFDHLPSGGGQPREQDIRAVRRENLYFTRLRIRDVRRGGIIARRQLRRQVLRDGQRLAHIIVRQRYGNSAVNAVFIYLSDAVRAAGQLLEA